MICLTPSVGVGEDIAAAEGVDGLLGITNQAQEPMLFTVMKVFEDGVLGRVRVLEFINENDRVLQAQGCCECAGTLFQSLSCILKKVLVGEAIEELLSLRKFLAQEEEEIALGRDPLVLERRF